MRSCRALWCRSRGATPSLSRLSRTNRTPGTLLRPAPLRGPQRAPQQESRPAREMTSPSSSGSAVPRPEEPCAAAALSSRECGAQEGKGWAGAGLETRPGGARVKRGPQTVPAHAAQTYRHTDTVHTHTQPPYTPPATYTQTHRTDTPDSPQHTHTPYTHTPYHTLGLKWNPQTCWSPPPPSWRRTGSGQRRQPRESVQWDAMWGGGLGSKV